MLESPPHLNFWSVPACRVWRALRPCLCSGCFHSSYFFFIVIIRLRYHQPTKDYAARKTREGKGKLEIIRCVMESFTGDSLLEVCSDFSTTLLKDSATLLAMSESCFATGFHLL